MTDSTGTINPAVMPLFTALTQQNHARSARIWLTINPHATKLLRDLAHDVVPLEHATFTDHPEPAKVAFLRELCIEHGLLEPVSLDIERFQTWLVSKLPAADPADARLIRQYARWVHLNRMQHLADTGALKKGTFLAAKQSTTVALGFLQHIRASGLTPTTCTQACVDDWLTTGPTTQSLARGFVRWASAHRHLSPVVFPYRVARTEPVITQQQRLGHIARLLVPSDQLATDERVAALLLLLYAQPLARIAGMRLDQIRDEHGLLTVTFTGNALTIPARSLRSSGTIWRHCRIRTPPLTATAPGCSPAVAPVSTCTRTRS